MGRDRLQLMVELAGGVGGMLFLGAVDEKINSLAFDEPLRHLMNPKILGDFVVLRVGMGDPADQDDGGGAVGENGKIGFVVAGSGLGVVGAAVDGAGVEADRGDRVEEGSEAIAPCWGEPVRVTQFEAKGMIRGEGGEKLGEIVAVGGAVTGGKLGEHGAEAIAQSSF